MREVEDELLLAKAELDTTKLAASEEVAELQARAERLEDDLDAERMARQELQSLLDAERVLHGHAVEDLERRLAEATRLQQASVHASTDLQKQAQRQLQAELEKEAKARQAVEAQLQQLQTQHRQELESYRLRLEQDIRLQLEEQLTVSLERSLRASITEEVLSQEVQPVGAAAAGAPARAGSLRPAARATAPAAAAAAVQPSAVPAGLGSPAGPSTADRFAALREKAQGLQSRMATTKAISMPVVTEEEATEAVADVVATMTALGHLHDAAPPVGHDRIASRTLKQSVRRGEFPAKRAEAATVFMDEQVRVACLAAGAFPPSGCSLPVPWRPFLCHFLPLLLRQLRKVVAAIQAHGTNRNGRISITYGDLNAKAGHEFHVSASSPAPCPSILADTSRSLQVLAGALRAAKKKKASATLLPGGPHPSSAGSGHPNLGWVGSWWTLHKR